MPALLLLVAALVTNYMRHRLGLSTICQWLRRLPLIVVAAGLLGFYGWFAPHLLRDFYGKRARAAAHSVRHADQ